MTLGGLDLVWCMNLCLHAFFGKDFSNSWWFKIRTRMFTYICGVSRLHIISQSYLLVVLFFFISLYFLCVATAEPCHATISSQWSGPRTSTTSIIMAPWFSLEPMKLLMVGACDRNRVKRLCLLNRLRGWLERKLLINHGLKLGKHHRLDR